MKSKGRREAASAIGCRCVQRECKKALKLADDGVCAWTIGCVSDSLHPSMVDDSTTYAPESTLVADPPGGIRQTLS
jgi:hypothetical protein